MPRFIKYHNSVLLSFAKFSLFFYRKVVSGLTFRSTAPVIFFGTFVTLYKQQMTGVVFTIGVNLLKEIEAKNVIQEVI